MSSSSLEVFVSRSLIKLAQNSAGDLGETSKESKWLDPRFTYGKQLTKTVSICVHKLFTLNKLKSAEQASIMR